MQTQADPLNYHFGLDPDNAISNLVPAAIAPSSTPIAEPTEAFTAPAVTTLAPAAPAVPESPIFFTEPLSKRPLKIPEPYVPTRKRSDVPIEDQITAKAFSKCSANGLTYNLGEKPPAVPGLSVSQDAPAYQIPLVAAKAVTSRPHKRKRNVDNKANTAGIFATFKIAGGLLILTLATFCFCQAFAHAQKNSSIYMKQAGDIAVSCGARSIAMKIFDDNLRQPQNAAILVEWGTTSRSHGNLDDALAYFNQAILLNPDYPMAYLNRSATYLDLKQPQKAIADASKAINLNPDYAMAYNNRGCIYVATGKFALAVADFSKAITLEPDTVRYWLNRGNCYLQAKQYKQAIQNYDFAIAHGNVPAKEMKLQAQKLMTPVHTVHTKKHQNHR